MTEIDLQGKLDSILYLVEDEAAITDESEQRNIFCFGKDWWSL